MRRIITGIITILLSAGLWAVPAKRGWQTFTQADGSTIELQQIGDEFYHFMINRDGMQVKQNNAGMYEVIGDAPSPEEARTRRAQAKARRMRKIGSAPNKAPRGVVILANFKDKQMQSSHTQAVFDELCNSTNCTVNTYNNVQYGSAAQYFADQSNGEYRPQFDVYGPVTLSRNYAYYGEDGSEEGDDKYATTAVVEACLLANAQYSDLDFTNYDSNNDGKVDFVYVIYAGKGQADGGDANTIWPHNWEVESAIYYGNCTYTKEQAKVDGKYLNNYACSAELSGNNLSGIGTLCHEFGHVMGLPDFYDTNYGTNYKNELTPNEWDIMDGGSYNGGGHCPPNYDPWEKYFFGWVTPVNPGSEGANSTLNANGTEDYNVYQINSAGSLQTATTAGLNYYVENRQQSGWDKFIPAHGMVIWKCNYNSSAWSGNTPNNTANAPKFTIVCSSGTKIGSSNGSGNVFGGSNSSATSWGGVSGKPLTEIKETNKVITFKYMGGAAGHNIVTNATGCTITPSVLTVENGVSFTATITPKSNVYEFTSLTVTLGSTTLTQNTHYTLSSDHKTLTVLGSSITGATSNAVTITAVWSKAQCSYDILQEPEVCTISSESGTVPTNSALNLTITPASGYSIADAACWEVEMGEQKLIYGIDFTYNSSTGAFSIAEVVDDVAIYLYPGYIITWQALGTQFATTIAAGGKLVLPQGEPAECVSGKTFVGWCATPYEDEAVAPTFAQNDDDVSSSATYYAVYAEQSGSGSAEVAYVAFKASSDGSSDCSSSIASQLVSTSTGISAFSGNKLYEGKNGVKIGSGSSNGYITLTLSSSASISEINVNASQYGSDTASKLEVKIGDTSLGSQSPASNLNFTADPAVEGNTVTISTTSKRAYVASISIMAGSERMSGYTTSCTPPDKHKINLNTGANGSVISSPADSAYNGAQVALTIIPNSNYRLATLVVKDATNEDITVSGEGNTRYFRMPDTDVTVTSTFEAIPTYAINFYVNGAIVKTQNLYDGDVAEAPANPTPCNDEYEFMGWVTSAIATEATEVPTIVSNFTVTGAQDYYAVFSRTETEGGNSSAEESLNFSTLGKSNAASLSGEEIAIGTNSTITFNQGNANNPPAYYTTGSAIRVYGGGNCVVSSSSGNISQIVFTFDSGEGSNAISANKGNYSNGTWTGDESSITFTVGGSSGHRRFKSVEVTTEGGAVSTTYYTTSCETPTEVTVIFNANEGTGTMADQTIPYNTETALNACTFTREGYSFAGWATTANGTVVYANQANVTLTKNTTLYAKWDINSYTINLADVTNGAISTSPAGTANFGATVTITAAPDTHYHLTTLAVKDAENNDVALSGTGDTRTFTMPAKAVTISATFAQDDKYTVRFIDNGEVISTEDYFIGEIAVKPANPTASCDGYTFVGWWTEELDADNTTAKTWVSNYTVSGAQDYYAIYSKTISGGSITWSQVTSISVGDEVVIAQVDDGTQEMTGFNTTTTTANNYGIGASFSTTPAGTMVWTVESGKSTGQFSFKNGNYYLNLASNNNYLNGSTTKNDNSSWTVSTSSSRAVVTNASQTSRKIMWNKANTRFASYNKNHGNNSGQYYYHIVFYKKSGGSTTFYSSVVNCSATEFEQVETIENAVKVMENGQIVIIRGKDKYTIFGQKIQ